MHLKLRNQQLKTIVCIPRLLYQNLKVTANQLCNKYIQKRKRNPNTEHSHQITREQEGKKMTFKGKPKRINKMSIRTYIDNYLKCK